ncbi:hypothetical protein O0L34_g10827 [Tuta absoluta]|nr:hypothetical protein O0L34_g10827 [Tuta absoluta]
MRAWLVACAALALAHAAAPVAPPHPHPHTQPHPRTPSLDPARIDHIKTQILNKLGLSTRPTPLGAPPRDVVRQILARAADPHPQTHHHEDESMREVIAIAHRGVSTLRAWTEMEVNSNQPDANSILDNMPPMMLLCYADATGDFLNHCSSTFYVVKAE